ncbi:hypothetical protein M0R45_006100 [Rubus argutus]|uniref:Uncharacterized protein n=1 Tax=Rubus argutus TaxID=59490 RepID=A0AAW1YQ75_RUBAR
MDRMELYMRYSNRVKAETDWIDQLEFDDLEMDEEEVYIRKLEAGLYTTSDGNFFKSISLSSSDVGWVWKG